MKRIVRIIGMVTAVSLINICPGALAGTESTVDLPENLTEIREEAFYGDTSINVVDIPDTVKRIEARAFANSSVSEINLPDSLEFIADDAFADTELKIDNIDVNAGSYAYSWCRQHGYIDVSAPTNVSAAAASPTSINVTWTPANDVDGYVIMLEFMEAATNTDPKGSTCTVWDLTPGNRYTISVKAYVVQYNHKRKYSEAVSAAVVAMPTATPAPAATPTPKPTATPTPKPGATQTPQSTAEPTVEPTATATTKPIFEYNGPQYINFTMTIAEILEQDSAFSTILLQQGIMIGSSSERIKSLAEVAYDKGMDPQELENIVNAWYDENKDRF